MATVEDIAIVFVGTMVPAGGGITVGQYNDITARLAVVEAPGNVSSGDLADNSVTTPKLNAGAVTIAKIATAAVGVNEDQLAAGNHAHIDTLHRGLIVKPFAQSSSDNPSTTSTVSSVVAAQFDVVIPGTSADRWTCNVIGFLNLTRNVIGDSYMSVDIEGVEGGGRVIQVDTGFTALFDNGIATLVVGGQTCIVKIRYRSNEAGTTTAKNPAALVLLERDL